MQRLRIAQNSRAMHPTWPPFNEREATPLYVGRQQYRKLVVLLDADVLPESDLAVWGKAYLLAGLLTLDVVQCLRYADDGPPEGALRHSSQYMGEVVPGWAVLSPDDGSGHRSARTGIEHHIEPPRVSWRHNLSQTFWILCP